MVALFLWVAGHLLVLELLVQPGVGWPTADLLGPWVVGHKMVDFLGELCYLQVQCLARTFLKDLRRHLCSMI